MTQIFTAKTVDDAKALAARTFGVTQDEIRFEILEEPKRGLFGRLKGEAKVKATYEEPVQVIPETVPEIPEEPVQVIPETVPEIPEEPVQAIPETAPEVPEEPVQVISETAPEVPEEPVQAIPETVVEIPEIPEISGKIKKFDYEILPEELLESIQAEEPEAENSTPVENSVEIQPEHPEVSEIPVTEQEEDPEISGIPEDSGSIMELISGEASEESLQKIERAKNYLTSVLSAMNIQATLHVKAGAESVLISIETKNSGAVIGKHGDTLDALQYLTFMSANQGAKEYYRIILDTADYRERRRKTLEELAAKIAANVLRTERSRTLEPMNPYERRIIHSVIAETAGVISRSVGEEPYRKIVILPENHPERPARRNSSDRYHHGQRRNSRQNPARSSGTGYRSRSRSDRREELPSARISMDSMKTDFEKGYRRPRPEDELNTGLYGKLNFD